jgi:hypothetical protein
MRTSVPAVIPALLVLFLIAPLAAQKIETIDGVRVVHNEKGGAWGKTPKVALELVRKIGDIDTEDENLAFNYPSDVAVDRDGNIFILDAGNARIQKFGPDGRFLATIGRKGQGPGEFIMPGDLDIDEDGNLVVSDSAQSRIHVIIGEGRDVRALIMKDERLYGVRALPAGGYAARASTYPLPGGAGKGGPPGPDDMRLFRRLDPDGGTAASFGRLTDFGDGMTNATGNACSFDLDADGALLVSFNAQNRIEKYGPDGTLLWRADRPLDYTTEVKKKGRIETSGGRVMGMSGAIMNSCSAGIAVDGKGRAWAVTYARQLKDDERVQTSMMSTGARSGGISNVTVKTTGNTDLRTTDAFKLEIFGPDGVLLGEIPLTHFADAIRVFGDRLFLIDRERGVTVYEYGIVEK